MQFKLTLFRNSQLIKLLYQLHGTFVKYKIKIYTLEISGIVKTLLPLLFIPAQKKQKTKKQ